MVTEFKQGMKMAFEMTDMGFLCYFLGLEIEQSMKGIFLSQQKYAHTLLDRFGMKKCKEENTPMNCNEKLLVDDGADKVNEEVYLSLAGGLIYLTHSRPDLAFAVSLVSRFMQQPSKIHFGAAKRILSDWASCVDDRKSLSAYISATGATCQAIWLRRSLEELGFKQEDPTVIYCDNKSAINLSKNPILHSRSKHIELRYHFIREMVTKKQVSLEYCSTHHQLADVLTKALSMEKFVYFRHKLGVMKLESRRDDEE
ncbi:hypothetical protein E3N88_31992 [Mikania micrantha]|uniref:Reverse transcriptase Ty1/copia-type domain-containing protein n=1 Tax=Mikania micrantha TaxID=192012 RepID=A0A5N6M7X4_9ASTR|nr:hypothetical protein E3N88_31992 [Mikania micrantha]